MIFTDRFVYVHEPKTGGTFVTSMLFRLYGLRWSRWTHVRNAVFGEVRRRHPRYGTFVHNSNKHGGCNEIPQPQRGKKILATVRSPFDLYVSQYEFGWWKRSEFLRYYQAVPNFSRDYTNFPDLNFAEYVRLSNAAFRSFANGDVHDADYGPGLVTEQFLKFYFRNPRAAYAKLSGEVYGATGAHVPDMHDLHFIRTDDLNCGLFDFLARNDYARADISFILDEEKILPRGKGRKAGQNWERYYTPELKETVRRKEAFLFKLFPEFDV
jgi:hypothetical protein